jgi:hypothetical protein
LVQVSVFFFMACIRSSDLDKQLEGTGDRLGDSDKTILAGHGGPQL